MIRRQLRDSNIRLRHKLGQHILSKPSIIDKIVSYLYKHRDKIHGIADIGCGPGTLTIPIACRGFYTIGIDIDARLITIAEHVLSRIDKDILSPRIEFIVLDALTADALRVDAIVSSMPYYITGPLLGVLAKVNSAQLLLLIIQREVGIRIISNPGSKDYGRISVLYQLLFDIEFLGYVNRKSFYPAPEVDSVLLLLKRKQDYDDTIMLMEDITRCFFSMRNKKISNVARKCLKHLDVSINVIKDNEELGIYLDKRPYEAPPWFYLSLTRVVKDSRKKSS